MMEVAVHERAIVDVKLRVEILRYVDELVVAGVVEPARDVLADPAEGMPALRRPPELLRSRDGDFDRLGLGEGRGLIARSRALEQHRPPASVVT